MTHGWGILTCSLKNSALLLQAGWLLVSGMAAEQCQCMYVSACPGLVRLQEFTPGNWQVHAKEHMQIMCQITALAKCRGVCHAQQVLPAGASMIGGCCRTTPEHISAIAKAIK